MFRDLLTASQSRPSSSRKPTKPGKTTKANKAKNIPANPPTQTVLGANTRFVGTLKSEGDVQIEDIFVGDITARGRVSLGKQASLNGDLICDQATIAGLVKGDVIARRITVLGTGRILGNLRMEKLMTEEGAFIQGLITLEKQLDPAEVVAERAREAARIEMPVAEAEREAVPVRRSR